MSTLTLTPDTNALQAGDKLIAVPALTEATQLATGMGKGQKAASLRRRFSATRSTLRGSDDASFRPFRIF